MQLYRCKVRLSGDLLHEVPKIGASAAEILILREIHAGSNEAVVDIVPMEPNRKLGAAAADRERLVSTYGPKIIERLFGKYAELPAQLPDHADIVAQMVGAKKKPAAPEADAAASLTG